MSRRPLACLVAALLSLCCLADAGAARADEPYALDALPRDIPPRGRVRCPSVPLTTYQGSALRFSAPAQVHPAFVPKLQRLEAVVREVAREVYGRAPDRLHHLGTFNCRRIPGYPHLVSEHGLGNAIDVDGFSFGPIPRGSAAPAGLPAALRGPFEVGVAAHFRARGGLGLVHRRFLHRLALRLAGDPALFRVVLGPGYPGHEDHLHLDMATYRLVDVDASAEAAR